MINLPADVLLLIFSLLSQNDKLECMTVCRHWDRVLQHNLFQVIYIRSEDQLNQLIERVKKDPILGTKVEQLTINFRPDEEHDPNIFITLFPNVREFAMKNELGYDNRTSFETVLGLPWCENITKITESSSSVYTKTLLHSGLCKNLTDLELKGCGRVSSIIKSLANAPALKTFYLDGYRITFDDLELLHEVTPLLSSLSINRVYFDVIPFPADMKPAISMKTFQCINSFGFSDFNINNPHLVYASKKYTQLEELIIDPCVIYGEANRDPDLREEQRELWKSYLKALGLRLKPFSLSLVNFGLKHTTDFDFDLLDECGCQIRKLGLANVTEEDTLEQLVNTTQGQYIQSLTLLLSSSYYFSFDWLMDFPVLKELVLDFPSVSHTGYSRGRLINLADMFDCLNESPLDTLTINHVHFQNDDFGKSRTYPLLENLVLFNCIFDEGVDTCISRGFPNLKNLTLESCFQSIDRFMLPHTNLSHLQISNKPVHKSSSILVITQGNGQQRLYSTSKIFGASPSYRLGVYMTTFDFFTYTSKPFQKANDSPMLTVVCNSMYDFNMKIESTYPYW